MMYLQLPIDRQRHDILGLSVCNAHFKDNDIPETPWKGFANLAQRSTATKKWIGNVWLWSFVLCCADTRSMRKRSSKPWRPSTSSTKQEHPKLATQCSTTWPAGQSQNRSFAEFLHLFFFYFQQWRTLEIHLCCCVLSLTHINIIEFQCFSKPKADLFTNAAATVLFWKLHFTLYFSKNQTPRFTFVLGVLRYDMIGCCELWNHQKVLF